MKNLLILALGIGLALEASAAQYYCILGLKKDGVRSIEHLGWATAKSRFEAANMWSNIVQEYREAGYIIDYIGCKRRKTQFQ